MKNSRLAQERAEGHFHPQADRDEKGSAMRTIREDALAMQAKTARLRALRLAREAAVAAEPAKKKRSSARSSPAA